MGNSGHCHACGKEVAENPRVCPRCGAPNPTLKYNVTKPIVVAVSAVILFSLIADVLHNRSPTFVAGRTYPIAKNGLVCVTLAGLAKARERGAAEAEKLGCLPVAPDDHPHVKVLDSNATTVKVRVVAPSLPLNNFQGWTAADNLSPEAEAAP
jgi:hypothetical protein